MILNLNNITDITIARNKLEEHIKNGISIQLNPVQTNEKLRHLLILINYFSVKNLMSSADGQHYLLQKLKITKSLEDLEHYEIDDFINYLKCVK